MPNCWTSCRNFDFHSFTSRLYIRLFLCYT
nr:MAG TPA: hypothetical protein [Caudoviricetes sp.]